MKIMSNYTYDPVDTLVDLILALGRNPISISTEDLQGVANRLSQLANHEPAWSWRYLRQVLNAKLEPSRKLVDAMLRLGAVIDNTPEDLARTQRVTVQAIGRVRPGALVLADSKSCANLGCRIEFVPRTPNQVCHSAGCAKIYRRLKRQQANQRQRG
ncbi:MAG: hypothetical protein IMZ62_16925 [Chloroflexi bacterium]|nr:hypothetical protein [Chloroflexota bacterium]